MFKTLFMPVNLQLADTVRFVAWHVDRNRPGDKLSISQSTLNFHFYFVMVRSKRVALLFPPWMAPTLMVKKSICL